MKGLGVQGLDAGLGCGVGLGYGFGAGLMLRPHALEQLVSGVTSAGSWAAQQVAQRLAAGGLLTPGGAATSAPAGALPQQAAGSSGGQEYSAAFKPQPQPAGAVSLPGSALPPGPGGTQMAVALPDGLAAAPGLRAGGSGIGSSHALQPWAGASGGAASGSGGRGGYEQQVLVMLVDQAKEIDRLRRRNRRLKTAFCSVHRKQAVCAEDSSSSSSSDEDDEAPVPVAGAGRHQQASASRITAKTVAKAGAAAEVTPRSPPS